MQQYQEDGGTDDPDMYTVVYYGQHTCKPAGSDPDAAVVETKSTCRSSSGDADELSRSDSQCSNISVTCTSVVVDRHQRTASIESNCKLLEMAPDLAMANAEVNTYDHIYALGAFSPFDLDTDWAIDTHGLDLLKCGDWGWTSSILINSNWAARWAIRLHHHLWATRACRRFGTTVGYPLIIPTIVC